MKDIYEVLSRKEQLIEEKRLELEQLGKQVEVLRAAIPLLCDDASSAPVEPRRATGQVSSAAPVPKPAVMMAASNGSSSKAGVQDPLTRWP